MFKVNNKGTRTTPGLAFYNIFTSKISKFGVTFEGPGR